jgi:alpha-galactosidase
MKVATNKDINDIARIGKSFYPVEGYTAAGPGKAEPMYMLDTKEYIYVAIFNFDKNTVKEGNLDLSRVGLEHADKSGVKELWTSTQLSVNNNNLQYSVPSQDVRVYRIDK